MATITRYVNPDSTAGGDGTTNATIGANRAYVSLNVWEAAEQQDLDTGNNIAEVICETGGTADTTDVTIDGWTTSSTDYIDIKTSSGHRHAGVWNTAKYRLSAQGGDGAMDVVEDYVRITGLQIESPGAGNSRNTIVFSSAGTTTTDGRLINSIVRRPAGATGTSLIGINMGGSGAHRKLVNVIVYGYNGTGEKGVHTGSGAMEGILYNCTAYNCATGFNVGGSGAMVAKNCLTFGCTDGFAGSYSGSSITNCSEVVSDAPGSSPVTGSATFISTTSGSEDLHLSSGDTVAKDAGTSLAADGTYAFSDDIDSVARTGTWDIGADEYVSAGRTTKNTRSAPLGSAVGMGMQMNG